MSDNALSRFNERGFDLHKALDNLDGRTSIYKRLVGVFRQTYPETMAMIEEAVESGDYVSVAVQVHNLGGSSLTLGAVDFYKQCKDFENAMRFSPETTEPDLLMYHLKQTLEKVNVALDEIIAQW